MAEGLKRYSWRSKNKQMNQLQIEQDQLNSSVTKIYLLNLCLFFFFFFYNLKVNWQELGATLEAWLIVLQQILNREASSLWVYLPAPGLAADHRWQSAFDYCTGCFQAFHIWLPLPQWFGCNYCCLCFFPDGVLTCWPVCVFDRSLSWGLIYV